MNRWTKGGSALTVLLFVVAGPLASQQGCGGDESGTETNGTTTTTTPGSCGAGETECSGVCVNTFTDADHCGGCNNACGTDQDCINGSCECAAGTTECPSGCVITLNDPSNCGSCDHQCGEAETCINGNCQCPGGLASCSSGCTDTQTDKLNCGQCNVPCVAAQECVGGDCVCPNGQELCGLECVDTDTNSNFCGDCETQCDSGDYCNEGNCESISGCGEVPEDGYEVAPSGPNDQCSEVPGLPSTLPVAAEDAQPTAVSGLTLHHQDDSPDTDWYKVLAEEGSHILPGDQCYNFQIAFTPPDIAAHADYQMCLYDGQVCDSWDFEYCTQASDWVAGSNRYEVSLVWAGIYGFDDSKTLFVEIKRNGGTVNCQQYALQYLFGDAAAGACD